MRLDPRDLSLCRQRYGRWLQRWGYGPEALGWGKGGRQEVRFSALAGQVLANPDASVLDAGCGFADLYDWLRQRQWRGDYCGLDISPDLLAVARERHPGLELHQMELADAPSLARTFDYVICTGVFNARLTRTDEREYIRASLATMFSMAKVVVAVDFMSTRVDYQADMSWHMPPGEALDMALALSGRACLRHDYMPYEYALLIYRDDAKNSRNVFDAVDRLINNGGLP